MKLNFKQTKLILFNPSTSRDFLPKLSINHNDIEMVEEAKLLGVIIHSDLSWSSNTDYIAKKGNNKLWMLRRLRRMGADQDQANPKHHTSSWEIDVGPTILH